MTLLSGDEDHSDLSRGIVNGLTPPTFKQMIQLAPTEIDTAMNTQRVLFIMEIPTNFESDILSGRQPTVEIDIDAAAAAQTSNGMTYIRNVIISYVTDVIVSTTAIGSVFFGVALPLPPRHL
jgi:ABC-2 type transport system permease protein